MTTKQELRVSGSATTTTSQYSCTLRQRLARLVTCGALVLSSYAVVAAETPLLDCPLRDAPFSVDLPLIDVFLSPAAVAVMQREVPGLLKAVPDSMSKNAPPTMGAIMSLRNVAGFSRIPAADLERLNVALQATPLTDDDRRARCLRYDSDQPQFELAATGVHVLVFNKINGHDHGPAVDAATAAVQAMAATLGWSVSVTDKGGAFTPEILSGFDAVVWNNVSGDVLTLSQRKAFEDYISAGGGYVGIHGSGGDALNFWDWYVNTLLGARFIGHPMEPQLQDAKIQIEPQPSKIGETLAAGWTMQDEWYSFKASPRTAGASVVATLDETSYTQKGYGGTDLRMGDDHPIVWTRCVGDGRAFYTAIGHRAEVYEVPQTVRLLQDGLVWAAGKGVSTCSLGKEREILQ